MKPKNRNPVAEVFNGSLYQLIPPLNYDPATLNYWYTYFKELCSRQIFLHFSSLNKLIKGTVSREKFSNLYCGGLGYVLLMCRIHF